VQDVIAAAVLDAFARIEQGEEDETEAVE